MARTEAEAVTVAGWLRTAAVALGAAGTTSPRPEAEAICAHVLGLRWGQLWSRVGHPLGADERARADDLLARRASGEPLAYVTGSTTFFGLELACGPGVLVPRPETETLVEVALGRCPPGGTVVDVGTGTGAVGLATAAHRPDATVWATERSAAALAYARRNVAQTGLVVELLEGDLFGPLPDALRTSVDVVVSNPPYLSHAEAERLPRDVLREPSDALVAGSTGDEVIDRLLSEVATWVRRDGSVVLEVGTPDQAQRVHDRLVAWRDTGVADDLSGRPRVVWASGPPPPEPRLP